MATEKLPPAGLHPQVVKNLLDWLSDGNRQDFRDLFQKDPQAALVQAGYTAPGDCLKFTDGATLASPEKIASQREKLEASLNAIQDFLCPMDLQAD